MKIFRSDDFASLLCQLQELQCRCDENRRRAAKGEISNMPEQPLIDEIMGAWKLANELCRDVDFPHAREIAFLASVHLKHYPKEADYSYFCANIRNVQNALMSDSWKRKFIEVPVEYGEYVDNPALLGLEISVAFKSASPDLREAGNCIATDCGTAAVFHLMRAVEWGLRAFCVHLGALRIPKSKKPGKTKYVPLEYSQWEKILDTAREKVDLKISKMKPSKAKQEAQEFYYSLLQDLRGFKDAWRNHVMHARATYHRKDAEAILEHVRRFLKLLSTKVAE